MFYIYLILQRYGWHGADDELLQRNFDNSVGQYPWLDSVREKSVTELEYLHGHLNNPGALPTCILFRNKARYELIRWGCSHVDQNTSQLSNPKAVILFLIYSILPLFNCYC